MRKTIVVSALFALIAAAGLVQAATPAKSAPGTLVIVFKDGHRQTFNLTDIERVEFPGSGVASNAPAGANVPRGRYFGDWEVGDGSGGNFIITLNENGTAYRSLRNVRGKWAYVNGEAQVTWDDGAQDAIRKVGAHFQKFAYSAGKSFTDSPDNVTDAHSTTPKPI